MEATGTVLAVGAPHLGHPCVQVQVEHSERFTGARLWACGAGVEGLRVSHRVQVQGVATDTRRTKMGGQW